MWYVVDTFGFAWGKGFETIEKAQVELAELKAEVIAKGWDWDFEIEWRME